MTDLDVHLAEYTALKTEQGERIKARDGYMYSTVAQLVADLLTFVAPPLLALAVWSATTEPAAWGATAALADAAIVGCLIALIVRHLRHVGAVTVSAEPDR